VPVDLAKSSDYAIRGLLFLAHRANPYEPVLLRDIAPHAKAPVPYLSKVFQSLRASRLVRSHRGRERGYSLARPPQDVSLYDIIIAMEGPAALRSIPSMSRQTGDGDPFRLVWMGIEEKIIETMKLTTLCTILTQQPTGHS